MVEVAKIKQLGLSNQSQQMSRVFCKKNSKVSGDVSLMHVYEKEIQLKGRDGIVVNAEASIHPERDAQIPKRVLDCFCSYKRDPLYA